MNFLDFKNTNFFKLGSAKGVQGYNRVATFNACLHTINDIKYLRGLSPFLSYQDEMQKPHLMRMLYTKNKCGTELDDGMKNIILDQWIYTHEQIKQINIPYIGALLLIAEPDVYMPLHQHAFTKNTITFVYNHSSNIDSLGWIGLDYVANQQKFYYPNLTNFVMHMDGVPHETQINNWTFFWIYDFHTDVEIKLSDNYFDLRNISMM